MTRVRSLHSMESTQHPPPDHMLGETLRGLTEQYATLRRQHADAVRELRRLDDEWYLLEAEALRADASGRIAAATSGAARARTVRWQRPTK